MPAPLTLDAMPPSDPLLDDLASALNAAYFDGQLTWNCLQFVPHFTRRWGNCIPDLGWIRLTDRALDLPDWVLDYLLMHELSHLVVPSHGPQFWAVCRRFPLVDRAHGFLAHEARVWAELPTDLQGDVFAWLELSQFIRLTEWQVGYLQAFERLLDVLAASQPADTEADGQLSLLSPVLQHPSALEHRPSRRRRAARKSEHGAGPPQAQQGPASPAVPAMPR